MCLCTVASELSPRPCADFLERRRVAVLLHELGDEVVHLPLSSGDCHGEIVGEYKANVKKIKRQSQVIRGFIQACGISAISAVKGFWFYSRSLPEFAKGRTDEQIGQPKASDSDQPTELFDVTAFKYR